MPLKPQKLPSREFLQSKLRYDPVHGHLYWRTGKRVMQRADGEMQNGYYRVRLDIGGRLRTFQAHRVIWKMIHGVDPHPEIDHIDRDSSNNREFNLRVVSRLENAMNRTVKRKYEDGVGVYQTKNGRFKAQIGSRQGSRHLGTFDTAAEAANAYKNAFAAIHSPSPIGEG